MPPYNSISHIMPEKLPTIWPCPDHTLAKHAILRRYLQAWFPILGRRWPKLVYMDGFAGPGIYSGGEPGSPIIALETARACFEQADKNLVFLFVESDRNRYDNLESIIKQRNDPFQVKVENAVFKDVLEPVMDLVHSDELS